MTTRLIGLAALAAALSLAGCGGDVTAEPAAPAPPTAAPQAPSEPPGATRTSRSGVEAAPAADPARDRPPTLTGTTLDGEPISTEDFRGRPVAVLFFAFH